MPRPKANKDKVPTVPQPVAPATAIVAPRHIEYDAFIRVRDSTTARLKTIEQLIGSFAEDYMRQTNLLLGFPGPDDGISFDATGLAGLQASLESLTNLAPAMPQQAMIMAPPEEQKKERKKRTHDPNAPKRPLTPYFLYMQTARPIIAADLGASAPKGAVQEEGQRRWATMSANEKAGWNQAYQYNLRLYNARVHSYKAGNQSAKNMDDQEALGYAEAHDIPMPSDDHGTNDQAAIAEQLGGADAHGEVDDAPPSKVKKTGAGRKRKTAGEDEIAQAPQTPASPAQKRRRSTKAAEAEEPKKSGRKKAAKA